MGDVREPTRVLRSVLEDSRRWQSVDRRVDDIVISTPPKSGTTWMQGIVTSLLWPEGDAPNIPQALGPWIEMRAKPIDELATEVEAIEHRRFLKSHSPADCLPIHEDGKYVVVYRDGRDAIVSWANHRRTMRAEIWAALNDLAALDGVGPVPTTWDGDMDALFEEWLGLCSSITHLASWWPLRHEAFVIFVHYNDLTADLAGEMRRLATYLEIDVQEASWPEVVARCSIDEMRATAAASGLVDVAFEGGAHSFFDQGVNGRWRGQLTDDQLARYDAHVADGLPPDAADWLERGSLRSGKRPDEM